MPSCKGRLDAPECQNGHLTIAVIGVLFKVDRKTTVIHGVVGSFSRLVIRLRTDQPSGELIILYANNPVLVTLLSQLACCCVILLVDV